MDIKLSEDQFEIARHARRFCENESSMEYVRAMFEDPRGFTDEVWAKMAEMGWMGMRIPESYGGMELGLLDLAVVLEEMGRGVTPGPFFSTVLLAAETLMAAGNEGQKAEYLPGIAAGEIKGTLALHEPDGGADLGYIQMEAREDGEGYILDGTKIAVPDAHVADFLVCAARTKKGKQPGRGLTLFLLDTASSGLSVSRFLPWTAPASSVPSSSEERGWAPKPYSEFPTRDGNHSCGPCKWLRSPSVPSAWAGRSGPWRLLPSTPRYASSSISPSAPSRPSNTDARRCT